MENAGWTSALKAVNGLWQVSPPRLHPVHNETHNRLPARQTGGAAPGLKAAETLEACP